MTSFLPYALDLAAVAVLTFVLYLPRHRRRELVVAYLGVNVGVLAVSSTLASTSVGAGLGLGLFGVLSIIRLRSDELAQQEVAYYFSALALGLLGGLPLTPLWATGALMALVVLAMYVGDHPRLLPRYRSQLMTLDRAFTDRTALVAHLERLLDRERVRSGGRRAGGGVVTPHATSRGHGHAGSIRGRRPGYLSRANGPTDRRTQTTVRRRAARDGHLGLLDRSRARRHRTATQTYLRSNDARRPRS